MSFFSAAEEPPRPKGQSHRPDGASTPWAKLFPALAAAGAGLIVAVPGVILVTESSTEDSRPTISTPENLDQSLLGQVPYGSR